MAGNQSTPTAQPDTAPPPGNTELEARRLARTYANMGWYITPLNGKRPRLKDWPNKATNSEATIAKWIIAGNVGLVTGSGSGVVVIDVDPRNGGNDSLAKLADQCGPLPATVVCNTGGGGQHLYFQYWEGAKSRKPLAGIDFQCNGRCVVLPPSMHPDTGALYDWEIPPAEDAIAELPESWKYALANPEQIKELPPEQSQGPIPVGERNSTLFNLAAQLAKGGASESRISRLVTEENAIRCEIPLNCGEIQSIVRASLKYRQGNQSALTRFQQAVGYAEIPTARKAALWALSLFADQHGRNCYPTIEQISKRASLNRKHAGKHLQIAESEGWIARITHSRATGPGFNYSYRLQIPGINEGSKDES